MSDLVNIFCEERRPYYGAVAQWLPRRPAKPFPFGCAGSNPAGIEVFFAYIITVVILPTTYKGVDL